VDPQIPLSSLQIGQRVLCNEAFAVVQGLGFDRNGPIVRVDELLSDGRLRIGQESGLMPLVILRSALLAKEKLKPGLEVRLDVNQRVALEVVGMGKRVERSLETVTILPWEAIGGQDDSGSGDPRHHRAAVLHRDLFNASNTVPKASCAWTARLRQDLLGKATAYNLRQQIKAQPARSPRILPPCEGAGDPQHVGRGIRRQVRDLCAVPGTSERWRPGFLFIDEAESVLGTRRAAAPQHLEHVGVMFCTEMDGLGRSKTSSSFLPPTELI
jgi:proteasome-associated ATPase